MQEYLAADNMLLKSMNILVKPVQHDYIKHIVVAKKKMQQQ